VIHRLVVLRGLLASWTLPVRTRVGVRFVRTGNVMYESKKKLSSGVDV
jgi:hypothetical protein